MFLNINIGNIIYWLNLNNNNILILENIKVLLVKMQNITKYNFLENEIKLSALC